MLSNIEPYGYTCKTLIRLHLIISKGYCVFYFFAVKAYNGNFDPLWFKWGGESPRLFYSL